MNSSKLIIVQAIICTLIIVPHLNTEGSINSDDVKRQLLEKNLVLCEEDKPIYCDSNGIAYRYYEPEIGIQLHPFRTASKVLDYYTEYMNSGETNETARRLVLSSINWIVNNSKNYDNYSLLEYSFPYPEYKMEPDWPSALAQGRAIEALIKVHNMTGNKIYLETAELLLNSFFIEAKDGGVTYKTPNEGWWYEEYPSTDEKAEKPMILNGMMLALISIYEYFQYTGDAKAKYLFDQGIIALEKNLPSYDHNGYSYYNRLGNDAKPNYHQLHVKYLDILSNITQNSIFEKYYDIWKHR